MKALKIDPDNINIKFNLGHVLLDNQQYDDSISRLREILDSGIENSEVHNLIGLAHVFKGDLYTAISEFEEALRIYPENENAKINLRAAKEKKKQS